MLWNIFSLNGHQREKVLILSTTNSVKKCMEISWENLYAYIGVNF